MRKRRISGMTPRTKVLAGCIVLTLLAFAPVRAVAQAAGEGSVSLAIGTQGPSAALVDLAEEPVSLLDFVEQGKPALLEFWATWCEQCEALQPQLDRIQAEYGTDLNIVAVAVGVSQSVRRVRRHLEDHDPGYPYLYDARGAAVRAYSATTTSIVVILDREGKVAYTGVGPQQDLVSAVEAVLGS
jgi:thiol-disulfide isomerase/thioredoxin